MNVHHLAALLVRITGIILLVKSIETGIGLAMVGATDIFNQPGHVSFLTFHVMWLTAGVLMLLFPMRIASNVVPAAAAQTAQSDDIPADALTRVILVAAGLYFIVDGIKALSSLASYWAVYTAQGAGHGLAPVQFWTQSIAHQTLMGTVSMCVGLILLLRPQGVARLITRLRQAHPDRT